MNKKGAMEMSVGTIVTIVLLMTVLILGLVLTKSIFGSAQGVIKMTDTQLQNEIKSLFSDSDSKVTILPTNKYVEIKRGKTDDIGIGISNRISGSKADNSLFRYSFIPDKKSLEKCGISENEVMDWMTREETSVFKIVPGESYSGRIRIIVPSDAPLCLIAFNLDVYVNDGSGEKNYISSTPVDIQIK